MFGSMRGKHFRTCGHFKISLTCARSRLQLGFHQLGLTHIAPICPVSFHRWSYFFLLKSYLLALATIVYSKNCFCSIDWCLRTDLLFNDNNNNENARLKCRLIRKCQLYALCFPKFVGLLMLLSHIVCHRYTFFLTERILHITFTGWIILPRAQSIKSLSVENKFKSFSLMCEMFSWMLLTGNDYITGR